VISGKKVLAVITARGGSKGIPRKNIREIGGKPLIAWSIEAAKKSKYIDKLVLSSEDPEIISVAKGLGCEAPFVRPKELAQDDTPGVDPVLHALEKLEGYDYVVLLQPTSPLRSAGDIDACIENCVKQKASSCVSVSEPSKSPYLTYKMDTKSLLLPLLKGKFQRRQDLPQAYGVNGAVYVAKSEWLKNKKGFMGEDTIGYVMPPERSIDVDTELDIVFVEALLKINRGGQEHL
jgi:CMP-N,N'-diacetyllegionaminic acid synthase